MKKYISYSKFEFIDNVIKPLCNENLVNSGIKYRLVVHTLQNESTVVCTFFNEKFNLDCTFDEVENKYKLNGEALINEEFNIIMTNGMDIITKILDGLHEKGLLSWKSYCKCISSISRNLYVKFENDFNHAIAKDPAAKGLKLAIKVTVYSDEEIRFKMDMRMAEILNLTQKPTINTRPKERCSSIW